MARVENTMRGARVIHASASVEKDGKRDYQIPGAVTSEGVKTNGSLDVPDAVLDQLKGDAVTQGWFKSGELLDMRKVEAEAKAQAEAQAKADAEAAKAKAKADAEATKGK